MAGEQRRSDRLLLTIPLRVQGEDTTGTFKEEGRTISISRHGARIRLARALKEGQVLRILNQISGRQAEFRVVGLPSPLTGKASEWDLESVDPAQNIWGIYFPPVPEEEAPEAAVLMECRKCHTAVVMRLTVAEAESVAKAKTVSKPCESCKRTTSWGTVQKRVDMGTPDEAGSVGKRQTQAGSAAPAAAQGVDQRQHPRVPMQLPVRIRDHHGRTEVTKTENVSKHGFCFTSEKDYHVGQEIIVACPYTPSAANIEVSAEVVRQEQIERSKRKIYGVRYNTPTK